MTSAPAGTPLDDRVAGVVTAGRAERSRWLADPIPVTVVTVALFVLSGVVAPGSLAQSALLSMLPFAAVLAIASIGQTLVIQQRGLDLSVPGMISLAAVLATRFADSDPRRVPVAIALALLATALAGLVNGLIVTRLEVTPLVATLALNSLLLAAVIGYSGGTPAGATQGLNDLALARPLGVPTTIWVAVVVTVLVAIGVNRTSAGRRFVATGASPRAARAAGLPVNAYIVGAYVLAGVCYGLAGVLLAAFVRVPGLFVGDSYLLASVAAVVVGGTPLRGGQGSVTASVIGALFLTQLNQLVLSLGAPTSAQLLIQAVVIAVAVWLQNLARRPQDR